jgi:hypothetical protein
MSVFVRLCTAAFISLVRFFQFLDPLRNCVIYYYYGGMIYGFHFSSVSVNYIYFSQKIFNNIIYDDINTFG